MSQPIEKALTPALTPEEWKARQASRSQQTEHGEIGHTRFGFTGMNPEAFCIINGFGGSGSTDDPSAFHGIAALCLHGQSFGFDHGDVQRLIHAADHWQRTLDAQGAEPSWDFPQAEIDSRRALVAWYRSLADRISSLLPPQP